MVSKPGFGCEATVYNADASIGIVHLDIRSIITAAATPQVICIRPRSTTASYTY